MMIFNILDLNLLFYMNQLSRRVFDTGGWNKPSCQEGRMSNSKCLTPNTLPQMLHGVCHNGAGTKPLLGL